MHTMIALVACGSAASHPDGMGGQDDLIAAIEVLPSSDTHDTAATWWGHNMNKLVRYGDTVYALLVTADAGMSAAAGMKSLATLSLMRRDPTTASWSEAATMMSSRPGNLLVDPSTGAVHVLAFVPFDLQVNDSIGSLMLYSFPNAAAGDFATRQQETVVDNDGSQETVNIRIGSHMTNDGTITVAFGLNYDSVLLDKSFVVYRRVGSSWSAYRHPVAHEYYYPFVATGPDGEVVALPVQDDYVPSVEGAYNIYYKVPLITLRGTVFEEQLVVDHSDHEYAVDHTRKQLVEQSDLYADTGGFHAVIKERLDPANETQVSDFVHVAWQGGNETRTQLTALRSRNANWLRLFSVQGQLYGIAVSWDKTYLYSVAHDAAVVLDTPELAGVYPFIASTRGGGVTDSETVDILLVSGASQEYPGDTTYYVSLRASAIADLWPPE